MTLLLSLFISALGAKPFYTCESGKTRYAVELEANYRALKVTRGGKTQTHLLSAPTLLPKQRQDGPQHFFRLKKGGRTPYTKYDFGTFVRIHYVQKDGKTQVTVGIVDNHREQLPLKCKTSRFKAQVVPLSQSVSPVDRHSELLRLAVDMRSREGELDPIGILAIESSIQSFFQSNPSPAETKRFFDSVSQPLNRVSRPTMSILTRRLEGAVGEFWKKLVRETRYGYYPKIQRYLDWTLWGFQHKNLKGQPEIDWDSVYAGVVNFGKSSIFEVKDFREFFAEGVSGHWERVPVDRMYILMKEVPKKRQVWFLSLWKSPRKIALFNRMEGLVEYYAPKMIEDLVKAPPKGTETRTYFGTFRSYYNFFHRKDASAIPEVRRALAQRLAPHIRGLKPAELEILSSKFVQGDRRFFNEILKESKTPAP